MTVQEQLSGLIGLAKENARRIVESGEEHIHIMLIINPEGVSIVNPIGDKDTFKPVMTAFLNMINASGYVQVVETWSARLTRDSPLVEKICSGEVKVSELPPDDRFEQILITAVENGISHCEWVSTIRYRPDGGRYLDGWKMITGKTSGRMFLDRW